MIRPKLVPCLLFVLGICGALAQPALAEVVEFNNGGAITQTKGGEAGFAFTHGLVNCTSSSAKGGATKTAIKLKMSYSGCTSHISKVEEKATVEECSLTFNSNNTATIESGCKIKTGSCTIALSTTENKERSGVSYVNVKESKTLEMDVLPQLHGLKYKSEGSVCPTSGNAGKLFATEADVLSNVDAALRRRFLVSDPMNVERSVFLTSTPEVEIEFAGAEKEITCASQHFNGRVAAGVTLFSTLLFKSVKYSGCKGDLILANEEVKLAPIGTCEMEVEPGEGPRDPNFGILRSTCRLEAVTALNCKIKFGLDALALLTNSLVEPKTVTVELLEMPFLANKENCAALEPVEVGKYNSEGKIEGEGGSNVEVM